VPGAVHVNGVKRWVELAALEPGLAEAIVRDLSPAFPQFEHGPSALANGLNNFAPLHVPILVANFRLAEEEWAGRGHPGVGGFFHTTDFLAPSLDRFCAEVQQERETLVRALGLGYALYTEAEFSARSYGPGDKAPDAPRMGPTVPRRWYLEDVACGLVPMEGLADRIGLRVPLMSSLITIAGGLLDLDFRTLGRTADAVIAGDPSWR
jgi:opine dehydrogenase